MRLQKDSKKTEIHSITASNKNRKNNIIQFVGVFGMTNKDIGMLMLGVAIGSIIPGFPAPLDMVNQYVWVAFLIVGLILLIKGGD